MGFPTTKEVLVLPGSLGFLGFLGFISFCFGSDFASDFALLWLWLWIWIWLDLDLDWFDFGWIWLDLGWIRLDLLEFLMVTKSYWEFLGTP